MMDRDSSLLTVLPLHQSPRGHRSYDADTRTESNQDKISTPLAQVGQTGQVTRVIFQVSCVCMCSGLLPSWFSKILVLDGGRHGTFVKSIHAGEAPLISLP